MERAIFPYRVRGSVVVVCLAVVVVALVAQPAGAVTHWLLPRFDFGVYDVNAVSAPQRVISIVLNDGRGLLDETGFTTAMYFFGLNLPNSKWWQNLGSPKQYIFNEQTPIAHSYLVNSELVVQGQVVDDSPWKDLAATVAQSHGVQRAPGYDTYYIMYVPCEAGSSLDGIPCPIGFHPPISTADVARHPDLFVLGNDSLVIVQMEVGSSNFERINSSTRTATHELLEAITDTGNGIHLAPPNPDAPWADDGEPFIDNESPWVEMEANSAYCELGDLGTFGTDYYESYTKRYTTTGPEGGSVTKTFKHNFVYQRIPSRTPRLGDPFVPTPNVNDYYSVTTAQQWYDGSAAPGGTLQITATGWSVVPAGARRRKWTVNVDARGWDGQKSGSPSACTVTNISGIPSHGGVIVGNGTNFDVTVKIDKTLNEHWCTLIFESHRYGDETSPPVPEDTGGDDFHPATVGIQLILPAP